MYGCRGLQAHSDALQPACTLIDGTATVALPAHYSVFQPSPTTLLVFDCAYNHLQCNSTITGWVLPTDK